MKTRLSFQKSFFLLILSAVLSLPLMAENVPVEKAGEAAANFLTAKFEAAGYRISNQVELENAFVYSTMNQLSAAVKSTDDPLFYIFNMDKEDGFVILSADDRVPPVLGYSLSQDFTGENLPDALVYMLDGYAEQINEVINSKTEIGSRAKSQWAELLAGKDALLYKSVSSVNPLVTTTWDQAPYYNDLCPFDNQYQQLTVTGCVATAMSQIMKFWEHPAQGIGYHSYNHDTYGTQSANFSSQTYNWSAMPNSLNGSNEQVAIIMRHCGVAVDMDYGVAQTGGSAAYVISNASPVQHCVEYSLKEYFDYSTDMQGVIRQYYDDATWIQMMKSDLDAGRPIQYAGFGAGGGHTWVCDGYDNSNLFHMNWGWGGVYDGYYSLDNLAPGVGGAGGGSGSFTSGQQALIGIEPAGGGGGGGGGSSALDIRAYSDITINPNPINFTGAFSVTLDIANFEEENFNGSLAAVLFNSDGDFVDFVQEINNVTLEALTFYTIPFENEGLLATPGEYYIGIYYKPAGGEYLIIGAGDYSNYAATSIVGPPNDLQMYSAMAIDPQLIVSGEAFEIVFDVANFGNSDFFGLISADLYDMEGNYIEELVSGEVELASGFYGTLTLTIGGVDVEAGSYILAIWDQPDGGEWQLVGSDDHPNPITIEIAAPAVQPDPYEDNNEQIVAYNFALNLSGNTALVNSDGSTIHEGNDLDYYKIDLPQGSQYKFSARAHDSYNSGNGNTYTNDVLWGFIVGDEASEAYDDVAPEFVVNGGNTIYFIVSNYYQGNTGTYLLDMTIEAGIFGVEEIDDAGFAKVYPNPSQGEITLNVKNWEELGLPATIEVNNAVGQIVFKSKVEHGLGFENNLQLNDLENGFYTLKVSGKEKYFDKQIIIMK